MYKFILLTWLLGAQTSFGQTFNLGRFSIGESRVQVELQNFFVHHQDQKVFAEWIPNSVQWIRNENNLLVPRALLSIQAKTDGSITFSYQDKTIIPTYANGVFESQVYIDLFNPETINIYSGEKLLDKITIEARATKSARSKQLIDYSCSSYQLEIEGIDDEYLSVGCKMSRLGKLGSETPRLEITMSSTNLRVLNGSKPPYTIYMEDNFPVELKMKDADGKIKTMRLKAQVPDRLYRFKTALGFGPYIYTSQEKAARQESNFAPSLMLYGKYELNDTASFKAFDALLYSKSFFNNSGLYFSYDLVSVFDERVYINALLGFQGLHYRYAKENGTVFRLIYPQGFEVIYKHAFRENYNLSYGMFLSTTNEKYTNAWLRYGKSNFLELNYINWGHENSSIKMWGLSVGIPFFSAF
jgi:hypothetical protein